MAVVRSERTALSFELNTTRPIHLQQYHTFLNIPSSAPRSRVSIVQQPLTHVNTTSLIKLHHLLNLINHTLVASAPSHASWPDMSSSRPDVR